MQNVALVDGANGSEPGWARNSDMRGRRSGPKMRRRWGYQGASNRNRIASGFSKRSGGRSFESH